MHHVHLPSLPWNEGKSPTGKFHSFSRNVSLALGGRSNTGTWGGGHPFDVQIRRIPAGAAVCPYHGHLAQWELFTVWGGEGRVRTAEGDFSVKVGDTFVQPPGTPHQLWSAGSGELEVMIVADNPPLESCFYPDSNKRSLRPPGKVFRIEEVNYFDGEDEVTADTPPFRGAPAPELPVAAPFAQRRVNADELAWDVYESPKGKFLAEGKELSIACGAKRNTPTGLGGHPFDLELNRLRPGRTGCPFHSHAAEWEMFIILSGTADVRLSTETRRLVAGDVVLHPPGEAHQITNASATEELLFYIVAENAPVDYWFYPDTGKWGLRSPRKFFRPTEVEFWDGEE